MATEAILRHRRDTAANWTSTNPVLEAGQIGYETDTRLFKFGNGSTAWNSLSYANDITTSLATALILAPASSTRNRIVAAGDYRCLEMVAQVGGAAVEDLFRALNSALVKQCWIDANGELHALATAAASTGVLTRAAIGTLVQAYDAQLAAIAGLAPAADQVVYFTSLTAAALMTVTAAARTFLDDATVGDAVNTLGGATSTGSGGLVRATSPTLVTPALGTPTSGVLTNCTDTRFLALNARIRKDLQRWMHPTTGSGGWWTTAASGSGTSWFITQPQYASEFRVSTLYHGLSLWTGTTTTGTNARVAYPNSVASSWLSDGLRVIWHGLLQTPTLFETARFGMWANGATPTSTGRPAYGVWMEKDATTLGNSNWWLCAANGGAVSTMDTGIAADATRRVWMFEFESTSSLKIWELVTSTTTIRGSAITSGLPSGDTPRSFTPFMQIQRVLTTAGSASLICANCDFGVLLDDNGLLYENPA